MPFNGSGTFNLPAPPVFPAVPGTVILASDFNAVVQDLANGLSAALPRDGQAPMVSNLPMGGQKIIGLAPGAAAGEAATYEQVAALVGASAIGGDGVTDKSAELFAANALGKPLVISGVLVIGTATTITVPIVDTLRQLFSPTSLVTIANGLPVRPEWFGFSVGCVDRAVNALPATGGTVKLAYQTYPSNGHFYGFGASAGKAILKANVSIIGEKMPDFSTDLRSLQGGSIIQGMFLVFADNFEMRNCGIDHGLTYIAGAAAAPGVHEGLLLSYPSGTVAGSGALKRSARLHNIRCLSSAPNSPTHALIIAEGYQDVVATGTIEVAMGTHGVVIKASNVQVDSITAYCNASNGVDIKTDTSFSGSAKSNFIQIGKISTWAGAPSAFSPHAVAGKTGAGVRLETSAGAIDIVQIDTIFDFGHAAGVMLNGTATISNVQVGKITGEGNDYAFRGNAAAMLRCNFGDVVGRNCDIAALCEWTESSGSATNQFRSVTGINCAVVLDCATGCAPTVGMVSGENVTTAMFRLRGAARPIIGAVNWKGAAARFASDFGGSVYTIAADWAPYATGTPAPVAVLPTGGMVMLSGIVTPSSGTSNPVFLALPGWAIPLNTKRLLARGATTGGVESSVPITIGTDGLVKVNELGSGVSAMTKWLSLDGLCFSSGV